MFIKARLLGALSLGLTVISYASSIMSAPEASQSPLPMEAPVSNFGNYSEIPPTLLTTGAAPIPVDGGRVTTFMLDSALDITNVSVIDGPAHGNATVNPDNTIALVLSGSDYSGSLSMTMEVTYSDGSTEIISP